MEPVYRSFPPGEAFPFRLVYKDTKQPQDEMPDHMHDWCEMVYVHSGQGTFLIDRTFYEMRAGDLFFIPPNCIHRAFPDSQHPVTSTAVFFSPKWVRPEPDEGEALSPLRCFDRARETSRFRAATAIATREYVASALDSFHAELQDAREGCRQFVRYGLLLLLLRLSRDVRTDAGPREQAPAHVPAWLESALRYIDERPKADLSLSALCKATSVSPAHFSRTFKQAVGMTVTDYVVAKRVALAKERLLRTDDHVQQIADDCGFESLPYFHKKFKKLTGYSPLAYKRQHA